MTVPCSRTECFDCCVVLQGPPEFTHPVLMRTLWGDLEALRMPRGRQVSHDGPSGGQPARMLGHGPVTHPATDTREKSVHHLGPRGDNIYRVVRILCNTVLHRPSISLSVFRASHWQLEISHCLGIIIPWKLANVKHRIFLFSAPRTSCYPFSGSLETGVISPFQMRKMRLRQVVKLALSHTTFK